MRELGDLLRPLAQDVLIVDAGELEFRDGRLRHSDTTIDRIYWRSTDFFLSDPVHAPIRQAVLSGSVVLTPSPEAYQAIADKRRLVNWSKQPELARDAVSGLTFRVAETVPLTRGLRLTGMHSATSGYSSPYRVMRVVASMSAGASAASSSPSCRPTPIWLSVTHPIRPWIATAKNGSTTFASSQIVVRSSVPRRGCFMARSSECAIPAAALPRYEWTRPAAWLVLSPQRRRWALPNDQPREAHRARRACGHGLRRNRAARPPGLPSPSGCRGKPCVFWSRSIARSMRASSDAGP